MLFLREIGDVAQARQARNQQGAIHPERLADEQQPVFRSARRRGFPEEGPEVGDAVKRAANIGQTGKPIFGQRGRCKRGQRCNLAGIDQIEQP